MITAWRLSNFKSVREPIEVKLAPLTFITGANSSGKSTLLQSMMMMAQTVRYSPPSVPLALNGPMVQLGTLDDVRHQGAGEDAIGVGFDFEVQPVRGRGPSRCDLLFDGGPANLPHDGARPWLCTAKVSVDFGDAVNAMGGSAEVRRVPDEVALQRVRRSRGELGPVDLPLLDLYELIVGGGMAGGDEIRFEGCSLRHFLPELAASRTTDGTGLVGRPLPLTQMAQAVFAMGFAGLRSLLSVRSVPQMIYPRVNTSALDEVGVFGELFATAFAACVDHACLDVSPAGFPAPEGVRDGAAVQTEARIGPLGEAVAAWLRYLGVAEFLDVRDVGAFGHEVRVTVPGVSGARYLTQVGSGVSQLLPVVVMCLLAPPGSTLLLELPELHLHPGVQTRLGDFFLAMALSGRQVIVETHSEYILHRVRYRVSSPEGERFLDTVKVHFTEMRDGATSVEPVPMDRYGGFEKWPENFFDQSEAEIGNLLREGTAKWHREHPGEELPEDDHDSRG